MGSSSHSPPAGGSLTGCAAAGALPRVAKCSVPTQTHTRHNSNSGATDWSGFEPAHSGLAEIPSASSAVDDALGGSGGRHCEGAERAGGSAASVGPENDGSFPDIHCATAAPALPLPPPSGGFPRRAEQPRAYQPAPASGSAFDRRRVSLSTRGEGRAAGPQSQVRDGRDDQTDNWSESERTISGWSSASPSPRDGGGAEDLWPLARDGSEGQADSRSESERTISGWDSESPAQSPASSHSELEEAREAIEPAEHAADAGDRSKKKTKPCLLLVSENVRGRGSQSIRGSIKWRKIADDMRRARIGIMAIQETHLSEEHVGNIGELHGHLHIVNSADPDNPTGAGGVALVFNKLVVNYETVEYRVLVRGRAIAARIEWHRGRKLTILAVYASTERVENHNMWEEIRAKLKAPAWNLGKPDVLLGDFNFVEDDIDRFPAAATRMDKPASFTSLKRDLGLRDGWRETNPDTTEWTWRDASRSHMSRIDRIYLTERLLACSIDWEILLSGITKDDHSRVQVKLYALDSPDVGKGRWAMKASLTKDTEFLHTVNDLVRETEARVRALVGERRGSTENPQVAWQGLKDRIREEAKKRTTEINCRRLTRRRKLLADRRQAAARLREVPEGERPEAARVLREAEEKILRVEEKRYEDTFALRAARAWAEAETMSKSWFSWVKERRKSEDIPFLAVREGERVIPVTDPQRMAGLAKDYHEAIQSKDLDVDARRRERAVAAALASVKVRLTPSEKTTMAERVSREDVAAAIRAAKNEKAAGIDGIIHELWKALLEKHAKDRPGRRTWADIAGLMALVFNDIEDFGVDESTAFTEGWMCPLYKKGDKSEIANYRPITLLNTDYKLLTKVLAVRLAGIAPRIVHGSQAGFVRGRSITDHVKITSLMLDYAEANEEDGIIVALDQEKAYDRIRHDYLLEILRNLQFPESFVSLVSSLYENAHTRVMVNGHLSAKYRVTRGVRQGDPLSCLLFNLAIEPLSAMLRRSELAGYQIPGVEEKLIATLYADDTTVYLSKGDSFEMLNDVLDKWCLASGARFNVKKTEIIPIGTESHRAKVVTERRNGPAPLPGGVRIAKDGEVTRILGSWPGNKVKTVGAWSVIEDRIHERLARWEKTHPTLIGRGIITQAVVGGLTQYLTAAQGMPKDLEQRLDDAAVDFFWRQSTRHPINKEMIRRRTGQGGMNVIHVQARNEAQYLTWVSAFLREDAGRPLWAFIADGVFAARIIGDHRVRVPEELRTNPFCFDWRPNLDRLPFVLRVMLLAARKYGVMIDDPFLPRQVREQAPVWTHPAFIDPNVMEDRKKELRCLRTRHAVRVIEDLEEIAELDDPEHVREDDCDCDNCVADRLEGCQHPSACQELAEDLLALVAEKWNTARQDEEVDDALWDAFEGDRAAALANGEVVVFDHRTPRGGAVGPLYRVFTGILAITSRSTANIARGAPGRRPARALPDSPVTAVVCGGVAKDDEERRRGGIAVVFPDGEFDDILHACEGEAHSGVRSTALAITAAAQAVPKGRTLHLVTSNRFVTRALTTDLELNESRGWLNVSGAGEDLRVTAAALRSRGAECTFSFVDKKRAQGWPEVRQAKNMALVAADVAGVKRVRTGGLERFDRPGMSALGLTQRSAHTAIRAAEMAAAGPRRTTEKSIAEIKRALKAECGLQPSTEKIWKDLRDRALSKNARAFLWKCIHGGHKVGDYFRNMPEPWKSKGTCPTCGVLETMEHILMECPDSGQEPIWRMARVFLLHKRVDVKLSIGLIMGCASFSGSRFWCPADAARAFKIVVSESAFLAWKIWCEKRIGHGDDPEWMPAREAIKARWTAMMMDRFRKDARLTKKRFFGNRAFDKMRVSGTWRDSLVVAIPRLIHPQMAGVLVGRGPSRKDGVG